MALQNFFSELVDATNEFAGSVRLSNDKQASDRLRATSSDYVKFSEQPNHPAEPEILAEEFCIEPVSHRTSAIHLLSAIDRFNTNHRERRRSRTSEVVSSLPPTIDEDLSASLASPRKAQQGSPVRNTRSKAHVEDGTRQSGLLTLQIQRALNWPAVKRSSLTLPPSSSEELKE
mmetsp:Transcript_44890/g.89989  ORF Transcript_44890/g.89989 Transcript_44890/m.89989 type:complete len:174 (-) Transcript_44890:561-1082(-)